MLWFVLSWIAIGLGVAYFFGEAAETMRTDHGDEDPAPAGEGFKEDLLA
jgi:hypothetical protein